MGVELNARYAKVGKRQIEGAMGLFAKCELV